MKGLPKHWTQIIIVPNFKINDTINPFNYRNLITIPLLGNLYGIILDNKINIWIEIQGKMSKQKYGIRRYHSIIEHCITPKIIVEEFLNNKLNLL